MIIATQYRRMETITDGRGIIIASAFNMAENIYQLPRYALWALSYQETGINEKYARTRGLLHADGHGHGMIGADDRWNAQITNWSTFDVDATWQAVEAADRLRTYISQMGNLKDGFSAYNAGVNGAQKARQAYGDADRATSNGHYGATALDLITQLQVALDGHRRLMKFTTPMMEGEDVSMLQALLISRFGYKILADGIFGRGTEAVVKEAQGRMKLTIDGAAGDMTMLALARWTG